MQLLFAGFANSSSLNAASIANFNFGKRKTWKVDGAVYAQPLYAPGTRHALPAPCECLSLLACRTRQLQNNSLHNLLLNQVLLACNSVPKPMLQE